MAGVTDLERLVAQRGMTLADLEEAVRRMPQRPQASLAKPDEAVLERLGIGLHDGSDVPQLASILRRTSLERESLTTKQVGALLGRDQSRIRQRLAGPARTLLGFHRQAGQHEWLIPRQQLELGLHDVEGWGLLLQALPQADETSPTALVAWLFDSRSHLGGRSRAQALADGFDVDALIAEAATFGMPA